MRPVLTVSLPTTLPACAENQMSPFLSNTMVCGSRTAGSGIGYFLMLPSRGSSRPMKPARFPENQTKRSEEHTSELQSRLHLVCRLLLEKKKTKGTTARKRLTHAEQ